MADMNNQQQLINIRAPMLSAIQKNQKKYALKCKNKNKPVPQVVKGGPIFDAIERLAQARTLTLQDFVDLVTSDQALIDTGFFTAEKLHDLKFMNTVSARLYRRSRKMNLGKKRQRQVDNGVDPNGNDANEELKEQEVQPNKRHKKVQPLAPATVPQPAPQLPKQQQQVMSVMKPLQQDKPARSKRKGLDSSDIVLSDNDGVSKPVVVKPIQVVAKPLPFAQKKLSISEVMRQERELQEQERLRKKRLAQRLLRGMTNEEALALEDKEPPMPSFLKESRGTDTDSGSFDCIGDLDNIPLVPTQFGPVKLQESMHYVDAGDKEEYWQHRKISDLYREANQQGYRALGIEMKLGGTRSQEKQLGMPLESQGIVKGDPTQFGFGAATRQSVEKLLRIMTALDELENKDHGIEDLTPYLLHEDSVFLDIGSGLGQVVMHVFMAIGCRAYGLEVLFKRVDAAIDIKKAVANQRLKLMGWDQRVTFEQTNFKDKSMFLVDGKPATHIFSFNCVFSKQDLGPLYERLNRTDFKVLAVNDNPRVVAEHGLKDVVMVQTFQCSMGNSVFKTYVYLRTKPPQVTGSDRVLRSEAKASAMQSPVKTSSASIRAVTSQKPSATGNSSLKSPPPTARKAF